MTVMNPTPGPALDPAKFRDPDITAAGERRASVALEGLRTLWINTGSLCNLACAGCYIESSPRNDRLAYIAAAEVAALLDEIEAEGMGTREIGFTGGEPFMNPEIVELLEDALSRGFQVLVLTNGMRPMMRHKEALAALNARHGDRLVIRVSLDHYGPNLHELVRGPRSWAPAMQGLRWLGENGFTVHVAGRTCWDEDEPALRRGFGALMRDLGLRTDPEDPAQLVLFPEMDSRRDVPEITEHCWGILGLSPSAVMCATSRMVVKRKGADRPVVVPCTLLPYDRQFEMGHTLKEAAGAVKLNHPHCARFCVLGGASCSAG